MRPPKEQPILVKQVIRAWTSSEGAKNIPVEYSLRASIDLKVQSIRSAGVVEELFTPKSRGLVIEHALNRDDVRLQP